MSTDELVKACGSLTPIHPRSRLKVYLSNTYVIDGETATQSIKAGYTMDHYERFIDSHEGTVICYDGYEGLERAFREWVKENSN